jgi:hypothetical protein
MSNESGKNGKGSIQRPCDKSKFDENWEKIFGRKDTVVINIDQAPENKESKQVVAVVKYENQKYDLETILDLQEIRRAIRDVKIRELFGRL